MGPLLHPLLAGLQVATLLPYCGVDTEILDFHAPRWRQHLATWHHLTPPHHLTITTTSPDPLPSAPDGSHPRLFYWVVRCFRRARAVILPLDLQHQVRVRWSVQ